MVRSGWILVEVLIALVVLAVALTTIHTGMGRVSHDYARLKSFYMAELTAENVLNIIEAGETVPSSMNGFSVGYELDGETLVVHVGKFEFSYEVNAE